MRQILVGLSGANNSQNRSVLRVLRSALNLSHINIKQPIIDATAALVKMDATDLERHIPPHQLLPMYNITINTMMKRIANVLLTEQPRCLIEIAEHRIKINNPQSAFKLFNGNLISNVTTEIEAAWVRNEGGIIVHLHDDTHTIEFENLSFSGGDIAINSSRHAVATEEKLKDCINQIYKHFEHNHVHETA